MWIKHLADGRFHYIERSGSQFVVCGLSLPTASNMTPVAAEKVTYTSGASVCFHCMQYEQSLVLKRGRINDIPPAPKQTVPQHNKKIAQPPLVSAKGGKDKVLTTSEKLRRRRKQALTDFAANPMKVDALARKLAEQDRLNAMQKKELAVHHDAKPVLIKAVHKSSGKALVGEKAESGNERAISAVAEFHEWYYQVIEAKTRGCICPGHLVSLSDTVVQEEFTVYLVKPDLLHQSNLGSFSRIAGYWTYIPNSVADTDLAATDAALGYALLGHEVGDMIDVKAEVGSTRYRIMSVDVPPISEYGHESITDHQITSEFMKYEGIGSDIDKASLAPEARREVENWSDSQDGGKYVGLMARDNGAYGSMAAFDDYGDESTP